MTTKNIRKRKIVSGLLFLVALINLVAVLSTIVTDRWDKAAVFLLFFIIGMVIWASYPEGGNQ